MRNRKIIFKSFLFFSILFAFRSSVEAAEDSFLVAPPASWVETSAPIIDHDSQTNFHGENTRYILLDDQVNASLNEHYHRVVKEIENADGVQDSVQLDLDFDPSYEQLIIHDVFIRRGTNILDRLEPNKIKIIQQERDLDMNIYDGSVSAVLFLEDVRVGDQIEYSYTVRGSNPIFGGHYLDDFNLQWSVPVAYERFRLLWPTNRFLGIKTYGADTQPAVKTNGLHKEYLWELRNLPAITEEDSLPSWYNVYPWAQLSDFADWNEVADWAAQLYPRPAGLDPKLQEKISEWKRLPTAEARLTAALTFVQDEIRYMGIEVGPNSNQPNDPSLVYTRRFGDCKDKAYLFCTLLRAMDIDAVEALVNTDSRHTIMGWLPSPRDFNHVVTRVRLNGRTYWLDPTQTHQGGSIADRFFSNYGCCLLVQPGVTNLTVIPQQQYGWPKTVVQESFVVRGRKGVADFTVRTRAEGLDANRLRDDFATDGRETLEKNYLNYYAHEYPKIKVAGPLESFDHPDQNIFETVEHYQIQEFWTLSDDKKKYKCEFYPQIIRDQFEEPDTRLRSMPMGISYPRHEILQTEVTLPEDWPVTPDSEHFQNTTARFDSKRTVAGNTLRMEYEYETLTNVVPPNEMAAYEKSVGQMEDALGYSLTWANDDASVVAGNDSGRINWSIAILAGIYFILLAIGFVALYQFRRGQPPVLPVELPVEPSGLGGWLILPAIGLFISPIQVAFTLFGNLSVYSPGKWHSLTDPSGTAYHSLWAPLLIYELLVNMTLLVFPVLLLVLFFQKRRTFPPLYIAFLIFATVSMTIDQFSTRLIPAVAANGGGLDPVLIRDFIGCLVWIPYMLVSKRVQATFLK